ncbi:MAG: acyltransferase [Rickettsiales bacterium]|nr:acyltransferase [Rickettsiales bacterium]
MSDLVKYRSDIDGLRAIAILSVLIFHLNPELLIGGFVGVDVFFVISGFLITKILLREIEAKKFSFSSFYLRRVRRIFPALFAMLFASFLAAILFLGLDDLIWFCKVLKYAALQLSNILFEKKVEYFDTQFDVLPLLHTWSLAVEEQYYLIFPLLLFVLFKFRNNTNFVFIAVLSLSIVSLVLSQFLLINSPKLSFFSLISRFWELGLGGLLAFDKIKLPKNSTNRILGICGLLLIAISLVFTNKNNFPGVYALPACFGTLLVIFSGQDKNTLTLKILSNRILVFFGLISYSLYLWHYPIIEFYKDISGSANIATMPAILIALASTVISYFSYKYIETPFRKTKLISQEKTFNICGKKIYKPFVIALSFVIFFIITSSAVKSWQKHEGKKIFKETAKGKENVFDDACIIEEVDLSPDFVTKCVKGEKKKDFEVLLFGDSHAWRYSSGVLEWAMKKNYSIAAMASTKCASFIDDGTKAYCDDLLKMVNNIVLANKNLKYVILANKWDDDVMYGNEFKEKLSRNIEFFNRAGAKVIILGSVPIFKFDPVKCISRNNALIRKNFDFFEKKDCEKFDRAESAPNDEFLKNLFSELVKKYQVKYFDPKNYLCDKEFCYAVRDGEVLYTDFNHIDFEGSYYLARHFDF